MVDLDLISLEYLLSGPSSGLLMVTGCCCVLRSLLDLQYGIPAPLLFRIWGIFIKLSLYLLSHLVFSTKVVAPVMQRQDRHWSKRPMTYLFYKTYSLNKGARLLLLFPLYRRNRETACNEFRFVALLNKNFKLWSTQVLGDIHLFLNVTDGDRQDAKSLECYTALKQKN